MRPVEQTTVLITGATDGLGRGLAERLGAEGATLLLHGRDSERLDAVAAAVRGSGNNKVRTFRADFSSLEEVRALAGDVQGATKRLDVLVNNAGIGSGRPESTERQESRDGHELRFAVNYLAGFVLTLRLLPLLRRSAPARIVFVSSLGQAPIDFDDVMLLDSYDGTRAYCQSKLAQVMLANELAERLDPAEVSANSLHPSTYMPTKIVLEQVGQSVDSLEDGVEATRRLAVDPGLDGVTGMFFDRQKEAHAHGDAYDPDARRRLWELSLGLTGESDPLAA